MRMVRTILTLLLLASSLSATSYTTNQAGNWSSAVIWTPVGVPGNGDTATINHAVTVDANAIIGTSPAAGNTVLLINSAGSLTVGGGVTFTLRGDVDLENTTITMSAGSTWKFDSTLSPPSTSYRVFQNTVGWSPAVSRKIVINGTSGSHVTVTSVGGTNGRFETYGYASDQWDVAYADFSHIGDATHYSIGHGLYTTGQMFRLQYVTFSQCGGISSWPITQGSPSPNDPTNVFQLLYVQMTDTLTSYSLEYATNGSPSGGGVHEIGHSGFDKAVGYASGENIMNIHDSVIGSYRSPQGSTPWLGFTNVVVRQQETDDGGLINGNMTGVYLLADYDTYNPHVAFGNQVVSVPFTWDLGVIEYTGDGGDGDGLALNDFSDPTVLKHIVVLPRRDRTTACCTFVSSTACVDEARTGMTIEHNTIFGGAASDHGIKGNEQCAFRAGVVKSYKSNLYYDLTSQGNHFFTLNPGITYTPQDNVSDPAQTDYNAAYHAITSSWPGKTSNNTVYDIPMTGVVPGAHDVNGQNPGFVDDTRVAAKFDTGYLGFPVATAWSSGASYTVGDIVSRSVTGEWGGAAINYRCIQDHTASSSNAPLASGWHSYWQLASLYRLQLATAAGTTYTDSTIGCSGCTAPLAMLKWVQAGFAPSNAALATAGHDGTTIGAVASASSPLPLSLSPTSPVVKQGATATFTASGGTAPYTYSLTTGSVGSINSSTGVYTAPSSVTVHDQAHGVQLHSGSHIYNTRIDSLPVHPNNTAWWTNNTNIGNGPAYGADMPINDVLSTDASTAMVFQYTPGHNGNFVLPPVKRWRMESGYYLWNLAGGTDRHTLSTLHDSQEVEETYSWYPIGWNNGCPLCNAQSGLRYSGMSSALSPDGTTDAAALEITPLILKYDELESGQPIRHALRMTFCTGCLDSVHSLWPSVTNTYNPSASLMPYGIRLRLKSSYTPPTLDAGCNSTCQGYFTQLITQAKQYGYLNADAGTTGQVQMEQVPFTADMQMAFYEVSLHVAKSDLELIDESALQDPANPTSGEVLWGNSAGVVPDGAQVCVTDATTTKVCQIVRLQGVTVGTPQKTVTMQAGSPAYQLQAWVNGATDTSMTWTMSPTVGTLNASTGLYTAPSSIGATTKQTTVITATSNADSTKSVSIGLTVLPSGTIRLNVGDTVDMTTSSNKWFAEFVPGDPTIGIQSSELCGTGFPCGDPWQPSWLGTADPVLYQHSGYGYDDKLYHFVVPNGTYSVTFHLSEQTGVAANTRAYGLEAQGILAIDHYDVVSAVGAGVADSVTIGATVTDNNLYVAARASTPNITSTNACCNGTLYGIGGGAIFYPAPAALEISLAGGTTVTPRQSGLAGFGGKAGVQ